MEVAGGSDPLDPKSRPRFFVTSQPPVAVMLSAATGSGGLSANVTVARPPVALTLPGSTGAAGLPANVTIAQPPVKVRFANP